MKTPVSFMVRAHDGGAVSTPSTLFESFSRLFKTLLFREPFPPTIRCSVSASGSSVLLTTFEISLDEYSPFSPDSVFTTFASVFFDPDYCWLRSALGNDVRRNELYQSLKSIVPIPGSQIYIDYLREIPVTNGSRSETKSKKLQISLDARLLDNARQTLVPSLDVFEPFPGPYPESITLDRFAWRGTILESVNSDWMFRVKDDGSTLFAEDEQLGRVAEGTNPIILEDSIRENLVFLWKTYALESDDQLTNGAKNLKHYLQNRIKEIRRG